jgi:hypothetical protein
MAYTTIDKPSDYFNTTLYTGNGSSSSREITTNSQVDWLWIKNRGTTDSHVLEDNVRGAGKTLFSNLSNAESTLNRITALGTNSFTFATNNNSLNASSNNYVAWHWKANGTASSNTDGSITSSVSANTTAGFSIVSYTGTGSNATVGHGLGVAPSMIIIKNRGGAVNWIVGHNSIGYTKFLKLNSTDAESTASDIFNDTSPTSSVFTVSTDNKVNGSSANYIAYCFAEKKGFSKFGSYTGNGNSDGTFVYTGFKPAFLIVKRTDTSNSAYQWFMMDNKRNSFNTLDLYLASDSSQAETQDSSAGFDFLSNGFKLRSSYNSRNASGGTFIYMAFAENPFVTSTGIPCTAR